MHHLAIDPFSVRWLERIGGMSVPYAFVIRGLPTNHQTLPVHTSMMNINRKLSSLIKCTSSNIFIVVIMPLLSIGRWCHCRRVDIISIRYYRLTIISIMPGQCVISLFQFETDLLEVLLFGQWIICNALRSIFFGIKIQSWRNNMGSTSIFLTQFPFLLITNEAISFRFRLDDTYLKWAEIVAISTGCSFRGKVIKMNLEKK